MTDPGASGGLMAGLRIQRYPWLVRVQVGLYRFGFSHRVFWGGSAEHWEGSLGFLWFYVSRRHET